MVSIHSKPNTMIQDSNTQSISIETHIDNSLSPNQSHEQHLHNLNVGSITQQEFSPNLILTQAQCTQDIKECPYQVFTPIESSINNFDTEHCCSQLLPEKLTLIKGGELPLPISARKPKSKVLSFLRQLSPLSSLLLILTVLMALDIVHRIIDGASLTSSPPPEDKGSLKADLRPQRPIEPLYDGFIAI